MGVHNSLSGPPRRLIPSFSRKDHRWDLHRCATPSRASSTGARLWDALAASCRKRPTLSDRSPSTTRCRRRGCRSTAYAALQKTAVNGEPLDAVRRRPGRHGAEGLGARARRHALHALVPAAHRHHRGKARQLPQPERRRQGSGRVPRQGADQGRARCVELPVGRHAQHVRSARLHGVGPDEPAVAARESRTARRSSSRRPS